MSSATATPSTYINDDRLPCLPVPALDSTVAKYVRTLEPYVSRVAEDGQSVVVDEAAMERLRATGRDFVVGCAACPVCARVDACNVF